MADEKTTNGLAPAPTQGPIHGGFEHAYSAYVSAVQTADADAWKRAYELYCEHQKDLWDAARDQSTERATDAYESYQRGLTDAWKQRTTSFEGAYSDYLHALRDAFDSAELSRVDAGTLSSIGYSVMLAAQGAAVARAYAAPATAE